MSIGARLAAYAYAATWLYGLWQSLFIHTKQLPWILATDAIAAMLFFISWHVVFGAEFRRYKNAITADSQRLGKRDRA